MSNFNYNRLHFFDKNGNELILKKNSSVKFKFVNTKYPTSETEYMFAQSEPFGLNDGYFERIKTGYRYDIRVDASGNQTNPLNIEYSVDGNTGSGELSPTYFDKPESYKSSEGIEYSPVIKDACAPEILAVIGKNDSSTFPTLTFDSKITFDKVSTELVETQSIYILVDNEKESTQFGTDKYTTAYQYAMDCSVSDTQVEDYIERFKLFFFIDNREQSDFRLFKTNGSDIIWSDRITVDLNNPSTDYVFNNGYRVDIGFCGSNEGVYEQDMYVCLLDTQENNTIYPIGTIHMSAETIGEDERYRTFFTNFGIPDPKEYDDIFKETPNIEDGVDYISINKHSKQMFLSYSEIFPYVGTYKALINAVKTLGYDDVFFKEWYKELGTASFEDGGYVAYDLQYTSDKFANTISNTPVEERIHLKKLNWITMFYKINEVLNQPADKWGFPAVVAKSNYYNTNNLVKIVSLKKWLEKHITGINCRIMEVTGEGVVFERYALPKFGKYQIDFDYQNHKGVYPIVKDTAVSLVDSSTYIDVEISTSERNLTIEDTYPYKFLDYCEGYFDENATFVSKPECIIDSSLYTYYGKTFGLDESYGEINITSKCDTKQFMFGSHNGYIDPSTSSNLLLDNNKFTFDPHKSTGEINNKIFSIFTNLPTIQIKKGIIKSYYVNGNKGNLNYVAKIDYDSSCHVYAYAYEKWGTDASTNRIDFDFGGQQYVTLTPPAHDSSIMIPISRCLGDTSTLAIENYPYNDYSDGNIPFGDRTSGFMYTPENMNGVPCFKITGYECKYVWEQDNNHKHHFPYLRTMWNSGDASTTHGYDFYLEIQEGKLIFNPNQDGETIVLNFSYEGNKSIVNVEIYKDTHFLLKHEYYLDDSSYVNNFVPGSTYQNFVNRYRNNADCAVNLVNTTKVKVNNEGVYTIGATLRDTNNNIFSSKSGVRANVSAQNINIHTFGLTEGIDVSIDSYDKSDSSLCMFEYTPNLHVNSVDASNMSLLLDGISSINTDDMVDLGTLSLNGNEGDYEFLNISNTSDRFVVPKSETHGGKQVYFFYKRTMDGYQIYCTDNADARNATRRYTGINANSTSVNYVLWLDSSLNYDSSIEGTDADVYVTIFDNVLGKSVYMAPAIMASTHKGQMDKTTWIYALIFQSQQDADECCNYFTDSRYYVYVTPAWTLSAILDSSNVNINTINGGGYPFSYKFSEGDLCKITYSNKDKKYFGQFTTTVVSQSDSSITISPDFLNLTEDSCVWLSPHSIEHASYKTNGTNFDTSTFILTIENTSKNKQLIKHIDKSFAVQKRKFDIDNAINCWMTDASINQVGTETMPLKNPNKPFETTSGDIVLKLDPGFVEGKIKMIKWSIYKNTNESKSKLYFECLNNVMFLHLEKGIYDISVSAYDEHGNKYEKRLDKWITVK